MNQFEKERKMAYVTSFERIGIEKGIQQGLEQGIEKKARDVAIRMLNKGLSEEIIAEVTLLDKEEIKLLQEELTT
jgi:predicted transposase/invertase (TIGR01784 family)